MISNVSFAGKVFISSHLGKSVNGNEYKALKKYSDDNDCDVLVLGKQAYNEETGMFDTLIIKKEDHKDKPSFTEKRFSYVTYGNVTYNKDDEQAKRVLLLQHK